MLNRSAFVVGHAPAFYAWLQTTGVAESWIDERREIADRTVYLVPAFHFPEEAEEIVEDLFEEIFLRELGVWQPASAHWPDTGDFALFSRWFTVEAVAGVEDTGRGAVEEDAHEPAD